MRKFISLLLWGVVVSVLWMSCEDYQDETYTISDLDAAACTIYEVDSLSITLHPVPVPDSLSYSEIVDSLESSGVVLRVDPDSLWSVRFSEDSLFAVLQINTAGPKVLYTNNNVNRSVNITLLDANGVIAPTNRSVDLPTVAACSYIFSRDEYELSTGSVLVRFTSEDPGNFKMVILDKE
ncbi:MAG: hypothetical protein GXO90_09350 [FCB group bacterium]|nr:hypothetical protein [FCB group bacterium]